MKYGLINEVEEQRGRNTKVSPLNFDSEAPKLRFSPPMIMGMICFGLVAVGVFFSAAYSSNDVFVGSATTVVGGLNPKSAGAPAVNTDEINFTLRRQNYDALQYFNSEYTSFLNYQFLKKFRAVIEPSTNMELYFYDEKELAGYDVDYTVCPTKSSLTECQTGYSTFDPASSAQSKKAVNFACDPYDQFEMTIYKYLAGTKNLVASTTGTAVCLYVRREVRSLNSDDWETFMDASYELQQVTETDGQSKYGTDFHPVSYLIRFHHFNAAQQDQDHIHEGNGFMTQHLKMTNIFEKALMSVNPSLSLPYWDFTIDNKLGYLAKDSFVASAKTYGSVQEPKDVHAGYLYTTDKIEDGRIRDGRFKDLKVEANDYYDKYGYGYMRAPWNLNPSPYISRFAFDFGGGISFPSCSAHYTLLQYTDMMDFFIRSAFGPHATAHTMMAGFYGCDAFFDLVNSGYIKSKMDALAICSSWSFFIKELWRSDYIRVRTDCSVNSEQLELSSCGYTCNPDTITSMLSFLFPQIHMWADTTKKGAYSSWEDFMCNGGAGKVFTGDHLESASPADPSFWVMHPTLERLLHAKLMTGGFYEEKWATDPINDYVCNRPQCFNNTAGKMDYFSDCCYGHYENDRLLDAIAGTRSQTTGSTNAEIVADTDPRSENYAMPYIYDNFEWDHCSEDFDGLLTSLHADMSERKSIIKAKQPLPEAKLHPDQIETRNWKKRKLELSRQGFK